MPNHVKPLDFMELQLLREYIDCGFDAGKAAKAIGWTSKKAHHVMRRVAFREEFFKLTRTPLGEAELSAQRILQELASIAFLDVTDLISDDGSLKDLKSLPAHVRRAIVGMEVSTTESENYITVKQKPKIGDKVKCLELLGKFYGVKLFVDRIETEGKDDVARQKAEDVEERIKMFEKERVDVVKED